MPEADPADHREVAGQPDHAVAHRLRGRDALDGWGEVYPLVLAVRRLEDHPLKHFSEQGIKVTISTDSRTVSHITLSQEFQNAVSVLGCSPELVWAMNLQALEGGFGDELSRARLRHEFVDEEAKLRQARVKG